MKNNPFTAPVLFLVFNRINSTIKVFKEIKKVKPEQLFISCDGPRTKKEKKKTDAVRKYILENINWKCEVKTLFRDENLGCKYAVAGAIDWFFKNVDNGIILEDDCLPSRDFFKFCEEMLSKFKDDKRIMQISGTNIETKSQIKESYFFSRSCNIWGWATWRRAWQMYDKKMKLWPKFKKENLMDYFDYDLMNKLNSAKIFESTFNKKIDTWDYQWDFACKINNAVSIVPRVNLITNIGFGENATHTGDYNSSKSLKKIKLKFPLNNSLIFIPNLDYEKKYSNFFKRGFVKRKIKKLIKNSIK